MDATLRIYRRLREAGYDNVGVVLQSYSTEANRISKTSWNTSRTSGSSKGAYLEPEDVAYPGRSGCRCLPPADAQRSLSYGEFTAIATP
ncbi:MAG: hypothetical protein R2849_06310 [Thermomicrobiales bacterium]